MEKFKNLILAPHIDDEVLGCYSFLNTDSHVLYFGVEDRPLITATERINELKDSVSVLGFSWQLKNYTVNNYKTAELISVVEECINACCPETVLIPHPSYNQDHRAVYEAAIVALRPHDKNHFVKEVLVYEQPHTFLWPIHTFDPNYFVEINIDNKLAVYGKYKSQVRSYRSAYILKSMAQLRGSQSGKSYAEAFYCKRYVKEKK